MKEEEQIDSYEIFEKYFKELKKLTIPATIKNAGVYEVNPTIGFTIEFILNTVKSLNSNMEKDNFLLLWMRFTSVLHPYFLHMGVHNLYESGWAKKEHLTQKILGKDVRKLRIQPKGFNIFYEKEFKSFIKKMEILKKDWEKSLEEKRISHENKPRDSGFTLGDSGDYSGFIEF